VQEPHLERDPEREEAGHDDHERQDRVEPERRGELIGEVRAEKRQREVGEVDDAEQAPGQAEPEAEQSVETAREEPRDEGLADQVQAGQ